MIFLLPGFYGESSTYQVTLSRFGSALKTHEEGRACSYDMCSARVYISLDICRAWTAGFTKTRDAFAFPVAPPMDSPMHALSIWLNFKNARGRKTCSCDMCSGRVYIRLSFYGAWTAAFAKTRDAFAFPVAPPMGPPMQQAS
jgi:hypothetical protein